MKCLTGLGERDGDIHWRDGLILERSISLTGNIVEIEGNE